MLVYLRNVPLGKLTDLLIDMEWKNCLWAFNFWITMSIPCS